jgi:hypothetical protein
LLKTRLVLGSSIHPLPATPPRDSHDEMPAEHGDRKDLGRTGMTNELADGSAEGEDDFAIASANALGQPPSSDEHP